MHHYPHERQKYGRFIVIAVTCCNQSIAGCPQCALNLEAENMIDRFIWRRFVPGLILLGILAAGALGYLIR